MKRTIKTSHGSITLFEQGDRADPLVLIVPGYSESIAHLKELVAFVAKKGYFVVTFDQPRRSIKTSRPLERQKEILIEILAALGKNTTDKVHGVSHSLGAVSLLKAATAYPDRFASILLMQPSGIVQSKNIGTLAYGVAKKSVLNHSAGEKGSRSFKEVVTDSIELTHVGRIMRAQFASSLFVIQNPLLALREAIAVLRHDITSDLANVHKEHIPIHVVKAHKDELFNIQKSDLTFEKIVELAGSYSSIADKDARHDTFWIHPERTAEMIDHLIGHS